MKRILSLFLMVLLVSGIPLQAGADWVDDWMNSATFSGAGPSAYEFSTRSYFSGGYASLRWSKKVLSPATLTPPSLRFGCGGVDIFLGSMSLLGFDYIVDRLKTILQSAGAFAFEYALHDLCPVCQQILRGLDAASDFLNQLQLDECRAGKAVAATIMRPFSEEAQKDYTTLITNRQLFKGITDSWQEFRDKVKGEAGADETRQASAQEVNDSVDSCGNFFNDFTDSSKGNYSVLSYIGWKKNIDADQIKMIRGLVGDVYLSSEGFNAFLYRPGCGRDNVNLKAFVAGRLKKQSYNISGGQISTTCQDATEGQSIVTYCKNLLSDYYSKVASKASPSSDFDTFVKIVGFDFYRDLRLAYQVGLGNTFITEDNLIVECSSYTYAAALLRNILSEIERLRAEIKVEYATSCRGNKNPSGCVLCKNGVIQDFDEAMKKLSKNISDYIKTIEKEYAQLVLSGDSICQSWKTTQKVLLEYERLVRGLLAARKRK